MNAAEAMEQIEGNAFAAVVNLASDFRTFLRILASQPEVEALSAGLASAVLTQKVFARLLELARTPAEEAYEHPADAALAAYLWLLNRKDRDTAKAAASAVLQCRQCWWARQMAEYVQEGSKEPKEDAVPAGTAKGSGGD